MTPRVDHRAAADGTTLPDLGTWHEAGWLRPLAGFVAVFGAWLGLVGLGLWTERSLVQVVLALPLTMASGYLFTLGHDAGHGSFTTSRAVNGIVGRLALVPSVHVFALWRVHHDVHHRYTNLRSRDFVWTPLAVTEFNALSRQRRALHRCYRHSSGAGLGVHYTLEIWAPRMLWPRGVSSDERRARLVVDAVVLYMLLIGLAVAAWSFVSVVRPDRAADPAFWISAALPLFVLPLVGTHWLIGFVIFLNHTHPDIVWYDDAGEWSRHRVQLEGSTGVRFGGLRHLLLPRRIMNHTAHHLDPGVPLRSLARAQEAIVTARPDDVVSWEWSRRRFREILTRCQLYDYDAQRWLTYSAAEEHA